MFEIIALGCCLSDHFMCLMTAVPPAGMTAAGGRVLAQHGGWSTWVQGGLECLGGPGPAASECLEPLACLSL